MVSTRSLIEDAGRAVVELVYLCNNVRFTNLKLPLLDLTILFRHFTTSIVYVEDFY